MRALLLLAVLSAPSGAVDQERLARANEAYESSLYAEAAKEYEALLAGAPYSAELHYNLGNARFRQGGPGSLGRAIASYLRAFRLEPRDADLRANLDFALRRAGEQLVPAGMPPALFAAYHLLSARELAALAWLAFWAACLAASAALLAPRARGALAPAAAAAAAFSLLFGGWWAMRRSSGFKAPAVVLVHDAEVRSGPGENFPVSFKVPEGRRVERLDARAGWSEIGVPREGLKGWMREEALEAVD